MVSLNTVDGGGRGEEEEGGKVGLWGGPRGSRRRMNMRQARRTPREEGGGKFSVCLY